MTRLAIAWIAATLMALAPAALAQDLRLGDLEITHPHARATPPNAATGAGYLTIRNTGSGPDRLIAGSADFAARVEIHDMTMEGTVMTMREIDGGLEIPAGATVTLAPGGKHLMFLDLAEQLKPGERRAVRLRFETAGDVDLDFSVETLVPGASPSGSGAATHPGPGAMDPSAPAGQDGMAGPAGSAN